MIVCPGLPELHAFADADLEESAAASIGSHLPECARCRDIVRALHRIDRYLDRARDHARNLARKCESGDFTTVPHPDHAPSVLPASVAVAGDAALTKPLRRAARRPLFLAAAAAAAVLAAAVLWPVTERPGALPRASSGPAPDFATSLTAADPDLDPDLPAVEFRRRIPGAEATGSALRVRIHEAWRDTEDVGVRLRLARLAAAAGATEFRSRAEALASGDGLAPLERRHALLTMAAFGGPDSVKSIQRIAARIPAAPADVAAALLATGAPTAAGPLQEWHRRAGSDPDRIHVDLAALGGRPAAAILVREFLAGDESAALGRVLGESPEALALLRRSVEKAGVSGRIRILRVLGETGDAGAVSLLEAFLARDEFPEEAAAALAKLARAGSDAAVLALARAVPACEHPGDWDQLPRRDLFERIFADSSERAAPVLARHALDSGFARRPAPERHGILLALGLCRADPAFEALRTALERGGDRRVALSALALLGRREAVPAVAKHADAADRGLRRTALAVLARLGGPDAAAALARALNRTSDRRTIIGLVAPGNDRWALPVLIEGLRYDDAASSCLEALRRRAGATGSASADPRWWRRRFDLGPLPARN